MVEFTDKEVLEKIKTDNVFTLLVNKQCPDQFNLPITMECKGYDNCKECWINALNNT